ncbi:HAD superfamily hydrolase (TIGR01509 family) [Nocardiopsis arvandica]|uniref:HAD superfamily hydrolase (TIGR01509 family) n=1 Tax=Nocardiopsis sinuspersici TaxID=501010 RepID=A0A7Z0BKW6_9ACTN|nr:HAD family hydrolase [Nocardiopsis sinuspersici]NYH52789.1 HAD superfamily hydrolase (TIGR01509 family) [Nocardiopsis sinuspersici]
MTPEEQKIVRRCRAILLDFDGPVCSAFAGYPAPQVARDMLARSREAGVPISEDASTETDPMEVLRYLFEVAPERHPESERMLREAEVISVAQASPTPGAVNFMEACKETGRTLVVVSNNSAESVVSFLEAHGLTKLVKGVFGRSQTSPELMKPNPYLLGIALKEVSYEPIDCLMVGDSATDIEAAKAIGVPVVGYANKTGKGDHFRHLGSDVITESMDDIAYQIRATKLHRKLDVNPNEKEA